MSFFYTRIQMIISTGAGVKGMLTGEGLVEFKAVNYFNTNTFEKQKKYCKPEYTTKPACLSICLSRSPVTRPSAANASFTLTLQTYGVIYTLQPTSLVPHTPLPPILHLLFLLNATNTSQTSPLPPPPRLARSRRVGGEVY